MAGGWNIFPIIAAGVVMLSTSGAIVALIRKERSPWAILLTALGIILMATFIGMLWTSLERPPLRTMGETRLWYSFFLLISGLFTYIRWRYRWIILFSTLLSTVFILINMLKPEIHDQTLCQHYKADGSYHTSLYICSPTHLWVVPHSLL
jgi:hypothetical protein